MIRRLTQYSPFALYRKWTMLVLVNLLFIKGYGQKPSDTIRVDQVNLLLIEQLVKQSIDSVRVSKGLSSLKVDSSLALAASDHAGWLVKQRSISHRQPTPAKSTVQRRAGYYGGAAFICGENIAASFINDLMRDPNGRRYQNITYSDVANEFVRLWVQSAGHYANIINPIYGYTGVSVSYHQKTHRVVVVQVFGYLPPQPQKP